MKGANTFLYKNVDRIQSFTIPELSSLTNLSANSLYSLLRNSKVGDDVTDIISNKINRDSGFTANTFLYAHSGKYHHLTVKELSILTKLRPDHLYSLLRKSKVGDDVTDIISNKINGDSGYTATANTFVYKHSGKYQHLTVKELSFITNISSNVLYDLLRKSKKGDDVTGIISNKINKSSQLKFLYNHSDKIQSLTIKELSSLTDLSTKVLFSLLRKSAAGSDVTAILNKKIKETKNIYLYKDKITGQHLNLTISEISVKTKLSVSAIYSRVKNFSDYEDVSEAVNRKTNRTTYVYDGDKQTTNKLSKITGIHISDLNTLLQDCKHKDDVTNIIDRSIYLETYQYKGVYMTISEISSLTLIPSLSIYSSIKNLSLADDINTAIDKLKAKVHSSINK